MLKAYTISGLKSLKQLPKMDVVQVTLNSRTFPSKRQTVRALQELSKTELPDIYIHYDFIYIASRFAMFAPHIKEAVVNEIASILEYSKQEPRLKGIVMHTDFGMRKSVYSHPDDINKFYNTPVWDFNRVVDLYKSIDTLTETSILEFYNALKVKVHDSPIRVLLENTTKCSKDGQGRLTHLVDIIKRNNLSDLLGICADTEHYFAFEGEHLSINFLKEIKDSGVQLLVHLNTIPKEVTPKSCRDRHSETTITECGYLKITDYLKLSDDLTYLEIPYIREVHEDTMFRELEQLNQLDNE